MTSDERHDLNEQFRAEAEQCPVTGFSGELSRMLRESGAARTILWKLNYAPKDADPTYDPIPQLIALDDEMLEPYDKRHLPVTPVVAAHLVHARAMSIIPAPSLDY